MLWSFPCCIGLKGTDRAIYIGPRCTKYVFLKSCSRHAYLEKLIDILSYHVYHVKVECILNLLLSYDDVMAGLQNKYSQRALIAMCLRDIDGRTARTITH